VFACYVLALLPATLIAGLVADTAGVRPVVAVSVVLAGVTTMLLAADPSWWLAAGRLGGCRRVCVSLQTTLKIRRPKFRTAW
jgi:MFS family permease